MIVINWIGVTVSFINSKLERLEVRPEPAGMVGSGRAVGGVVSEVVGVTNSSGELGIQLQRIVSRCKAEFFYVSYGDTELEGVESGAKYPRSSLGWAVSLSPWSFRDQHRSPHHRHHGSLLQEDDELCFSGEGRGPTWIRIRGIRGRGQWKYSCFASDWKFSLFYYLKRLCCPYVVCKYFNIVK